MCFDVRKKYFKVIFSENILHEGILNKFVANYKLIIMHAILYMLYLIVIDDYFVTYDTAHDFLDLSIIYFSPYSIDNCCCRQADEHQI